MNSVVSAAGVQVEWRSTILRPQYLTFRTEAHALFAFDTIHRHDCIEALGRMEPGSVDLVFADPPFNIGYKYDVYDDRKEAQAYLDWSRNWITAAHRVLKPDGTFWLAIGDDFAAELKILSREIGFHCRSWVIWYYTFGVNCKYKFSRSHTHLFHFIKDPKKFTFNREAILVPSARQLVYGDKRADKGGRLPDDTWILRPQDLAEGFTPEESVWYYPRVAGTFKEREGFHGCQMPEQLLGRIIKVSSHPGEVVLDPFCGSGTTVAVAKKLGRQFIAFDISDEYVTHSQKRLDAIQAGNPLDGAEDPRVSAPSTAAGRRLEDRGKPSRQGRASAAKAGEQAKAGEPTEVTEPTPSNTHAVQSREDQIAAVAAAVGGGQALDVVLTDPRLNLEFLQECSRQGLAEKASGLNEALFELIESSQPAAADQLSWSQITPYLFASEIAWSQLAHEEQVSLKEILGDVRLAERFDEIASRFAPGHTSSEYRFAALQLWMAFQSLTTATTEAPATLPQFEDRIELDDLKPSKVSDEPGLFLISSKKRPLYLGETLSFRRWAETHKEKKDARKAWKDLGKGLTVTWLPSRDLEGFDPQLGLDPLARWLVVCRTRLLSDLATGDQGYPAFNRPGLHDSNKDQAT